MGQFECINCGKALDFNDVGLYKKMINRAAEKYICKECLSKELGCTIGYLDRKIERFKADGCVLFI